MRLLRNGIHLGQSNGLQNPVYYGLGFDVIGQCVVGEYQPVSQHIRNDLDNILWNDVVASPHQRQGTGGRDDAQRCARRGTECDSGLHIRHAELFGPTGRGHHPDDIVD